MTFLRKVRSREFLVDLSLAVLAIAHGYVALHLFGRDSTLTLTFTVIGGLGIFVRRRAPWLTLLIGLPGLFISDSVVAPLVALYTLAAGGTGLRALLLTSAVVIFGYSAIWRGYSSVDLAIIISTYGLVGTIGAVATGMLVRTRRELADSITQLRQIRKEEIERVVLDVRGAERTQLAREMHDVVSHQVSLIAVQAGALQVTSSDPETTRSARVIRNLAAKTIEELRQMLNVLRASGANSGELTPQFTLSDLSDLADSSASRVNLNVDVPEDLPPSLQRTVFRTVQEGIANADRYAPGADVSVECATNDGVLILSIENGPPRARPQNVPSTKHGHVGLAERAEIHGGSFTATETEHSGYRIRMVLPLE